MAYTWNTGNAVKDGIISAASVNEARDLLNTMYSQVNCSSRNSVVLSSDNSDYNGSKDNIIVACTTVYGTRNSSYCATVDATQTTTSYSGNDVACSANNGSEYSKNSCDSYNASKWSTDNSYNRSSYESGDNNSYNSSQYSTNNAGNCNKQNGTCTGDDSSAYSQHTDCGSDADSPCTSARAYNEASYNGGNWTTDNDSKYRGDFSSNYTWDDSSHYTLDDDSNYGSQNSKNACSAQNSSRYGSRQFCPSYNNAQYNGKNSSNRSPYNQSVRVCNTVHSANTT